MMLQRVFAIVAHPDDIEFMMAGTLCRLGQAGYELHYLTIANGSCGTVDQPIEKIVETRRVESLAAAHLINAVYHESFVNDLEIFFEKSTLQRLTAVIRDVAPQIILTHPMQDYMEDHMNTCRLVLTAAFARGMLNYPTEPPSEPIEQPVHIYHCLPYGLLDPLGKLVVPNIYVDITHVFDIKRQMLAMHRSQKEWLDASQGIDSYLQTMEDMSKEIGHMSQQFTYAEGWTRHLHLGYCDPNVDLLVDALSDSMVV